jgi:hypothetical protein
MTDLQISTTRRQASPFPISARTRNARIVNYPGAPDLAFVEVVMFCQYNASFGGSLGFGVAAEYTGRIRMTAHDALNCTDCIGRKQHV